MGDPARRDEPAVFPVVSVQVAVRAVLDLSHLLLCHLDQILGHCSQLGLSRVENHTVVKSEKGRESTISFKSLERENSIFI